MKYLFILSTLMISLFVSGQSNQDSLHYKLDEYFSSLTNLKNFNGNVIVSKNGKVLLDRTYNIKGETDSLRVSGASKFIIASVSKVFIKYGILKLVEYKKLNLSDNVSRFIPDFPSGDNITIEQLMHHQSGLPRELTNYEKYDSFVAGIIY